MKNGEKKKVLVTLPMDLVHIIDIQAKRSIRSFNSQIIALVKIGLANEKPEHEALANADELISQSVNKKHKSFF